MKKKYCKPEIKSVKLKPQEAVLTNCKLTQGTSGVGAPTECVYHSTKCSTEGT